jgi:hypothetical protein
VKGRVKGAGRRRLILVGVLLFSLFSTPGSARAALPDAKKDFSLKLWPLFHYWTDPERTRSTLKILGPLIYRKRGVEEGEFALRPLFYWTRNGNKNLLRIEYLFPLGKFQREGGDTKHYFVPFLLSWKEERDEERREEFSSRLLFFRGQTEGGERYWGIFPIYGHLMGRFGRDEIFFYLWPLYSHWSDEGTYTQNIFWPIFSGTRGGGKKGFRVWPFYGYKETEGVSRSGFVLWPFFIKSANNLDTDDPERQLLLFPAYWGIRSRTKRHVTVLWPFFSHTVDERNKYKRWDMPWPVISVTRGEAVKRTWVFPLYYHKKTPRDRTRWILWPLYQRWDSQFADEREVVRRFLLLNRIRTVFNGKGDKISKQVSIWPLFHYSRKGDKVSFRLFHLIPLFGEGLERNWVPLYRVLRYERTPSETRWDILWGLYERGGPWE